MAPIGLFHGQFQSDFFLFLPLSTFLPHLSLAGGVVLKNAKVFDSLCRIFLDGFKDPGIQGFRDLEQVIRAEGATGTAGGQNCIAVLIKSIRPLKSPAAATIKDSMCEVYSVCMECV